MTPLTKSLVDYRAREISWDEFYRVAGAHMQRMLGRVLRVPPADRDDLIGEFYPRFVRLSRDYVYHGAPFDAYLFTSLRYAVRSRRRDARERMTRDSVFAGTTAGMDEVVAETPVADGEADDKDVCAPSPRIAILATSRQRDTVRRQLFLCLCKNLPVLTDAERSYYARLFDIPSSWLDGLDRCVHDRWDRVSRRRTAYREHRDRHFAAMLMNQAVTDQVPGDWARAQAETDRFHRRRWAYYRRRLSHQSIHLTNREVAVLLGIPKGSVDSALANLSHRLAACTRGTVGSLHDDASPRLQQQSQADGNGRDSATHRRPRSTRAAR